MENENKLRGFIKTTLREFLNEQKQNGNDKPPWMGTQYNQINKLYELTDDDFSYVPSSVKYLGINIDRTLLGNILDHYNENDEEKYQRAIKNLDFFFIYYNGKRYVYSRHFKTLRDKHDREINASEQDEVFNQQMNQIIHNTLNPPKSLEDLYLSY